MTTTIRTIADRDVIADAATIISHTPDAWTGYSGETVHGEDVATHLDAALALLEKRGWSRVFGDPEPELPDTDDSMSVKTILLRLVHYVREMTVDRGPLTLGIAILRTQDTAGDSDTSAVAHRVMDSLVRAFTGAPSAMHTSWAEKKTRTWGEVRDLLTAAAQLARTHGPRN